MEGPVRILHVFGTLNRGGAETAIMTYYRAIDKSNIQFDFVVHTDKESAFDPEIKSLGGRVYHCPKYKGVNHFAYKKWWKTFLSRSDYKIIHSHVRSTASIYLKIAKKRKMRTVAHSHSTSSGQGLKALVKNRLQKNIVKYADDLFACSRAAGEWLYGKAAVTGNNFHILNNAIETEKFLFNDDVRLAMRERLHISDKLVLGHVGRFHPLKNHEFLVDVFQAIAQKNKKAVLLLVGDGELLPQIKAKVKQLGLEEAVIFAGVRPDVNEYLQAMDVFLFPSMFEGVSLALIETQTAGLPGFISDTITKDVKLSPLITFLPIDQGVGPWVKAVLSLDIRHRASPIDTIRDAGYDVAENVRRLEKFYLEAHSQRPG